MATLYKSSNSPYWRAKYFDRSGTRVSKSTGTTQKREATRIANRMEQDELEARNQSSALPKSFAVIVEEAARAAQAGELTLARAEELVSRDRKSVV